MTRAAHRLFTERGYGPTTIDDITQAAEVARRTMTLHFPTKQDLALARTADSLQRLTDAPEERLNGIGTLGVVKEWLDQEIREATELDLLEHRIFDANPELQAPYAPSPTPTPSGRALDRPRHRSGPSDVDPALAAAVIVAVITQAFATAEPEREQAMRTGFAFLEPGIASLVQSTKP
ncbi:TetR/AcrR family transcriptional regulator [Streptomyces sp. NPDC033754]|uniref:TetR/AcrR family transcriptional regulator n=1 Tax=unclassified Streptomyces TaxID=2593676 RepID=UPI00340BF0E8